MTGTHARAEESVSFSLKELSRLEEERVAALREAARRNAEQAERRAREEEQRTREEVEARARAAEERRRDDERRAGEEEARLEGVKRGILERERLAAADAARAAEAERARQHEIELQRLKSARTGSFASWAACALSTVALGAFGLAYLLVLAPRADARIAEARNTASASTEALAGAARRLDDLAARTSGLRAELAASEARAQNLTSELARARAELERRCSRPASAAAPHVGAPVTPKDGLLRGPCTAGDPLCMGR